MTRFFKTLKFSLALFIALALFVTAYHIPFDAGIVTDAALTSKQLNELNNKLSNVADKIAKLEKEIKSANSEKKSEVQKKNQLDEKIALCEDEIKLLEEKITWLNDEIAVSQVEIEKQQAEIDERTEIYRQRIRFFYEIGTQSYLEILFEAESFSDFFMRLDMVSDMLTHDNDLMTEMSADLKACNDAKLELEANVASQKSAVAEAEAKKLSLEKEAAAADAIIQEIEADQAKLKKEIAAVEAEETKVKKQIADEVARLQKEEEESKKNQSSGDPTKDLKWPLPGYSKVTSVYGNRLHPVLKVWKLHTGIDIGGAPKGTTIVASYSGTVIKSEYNSAYGNYVSINHGNGVATLYAHMTTRSVKVGDKVKKGQKIGTVGSTGYSTGPHLHYEVLVDGEYTNPLKYFSSKIYVIV